MFIPVEHLGSRGVIYDRQDFVLPASAWSDALNVRFKHERVENFSGEEEIYSTNNPDESDTLWGFPWRDGTTLYWFYVTPGKIYRMTGANHEDISQTGGYAGSANDVISGGVFNGVPIINYQSDIVPQQWDSSTGAMVDLANWPSGLFAKIIRPYKNFLVAYSLVDSGAIMPLSLQWSSVADPGGVPDSWDHTDLTELTGRTSLAETAGEIIDAQTLRDDNVIYKDDSIILMRFTGGEFVFRFDYLSKEFGLLAPRCVKEFLGKHFMISRGDIVVHDGRSFETIGYGTNRRWLFQSMNQDHQDKTFVVPNYPNNEMWICFVSEAEDSNATLPNMALVWNWKENTWQTRELPSVQHIGWGLIDTSSEDESYAAQTETYAEATEVYEQENFNPAEIQLLGMSSGTFLAMDRGGDFNGEEMESFAERVGLPIFSEWEQATGKTNPVRQKFVRRLYPKIVSTGTVEISVGMQRTLDGPITWRGPFVFNPGEDKKIDFRLNGMYLAFSIRSVTGRQWKLYGFFLDYVRLGEAAR